MSTSGKGDKVGIFVLVIGLGSLVGGVVLGVRVMRIGGWPTAQAKVVEREVFNPVFPIGKVRSNHYIPKVRYTFEVEGRSYEGHEISPVRVAMTSGNAQKSVNAIPDTVEIRYDPSDPSKAYIETGSMTMAVTLGGVGLLLALGGLGSLLSGAAGAG